MGIFATRRRSDSLKNYAVAKKRIEGAALPYIGSDNTFSKSKYVSLKFESAIPMSPQLLFSAHCVAV